MLVHFSGCCKLLHTLYNTCTFTFLSAIDSCDILYFAHLYIIAISSVYCIRSFDSGRGSNVAAFTFALLFSYIHVHSYFPSRYLFYMHYSDHVCIFLQSRIVFPRTSSPAYFQRHDVFLHSRFHLGRVKTSPCFPLQAVFFCAFRLYGTSTLSLPFSSGWQFPGGTL